MNKASTRNKKRICLPSVPIAFKVPISRILSITDVYNVVIIPTPPTINAITAILNKKEFIPAVNSLTVFSRAGEKNQGEVLGWIDKNTEFAEAVGFGMVDSFRYLDKDHKDKITALARQSHNLAMALQICNAPKTNQPINGIDN